MFFFSFFSKSSSKSNKAELHQGLIHSGSRKKKKKKEEKLLKWFIISISFQQHFWAVWSMKCKQNMSSHLDKPSLTYSLCLVSTGWLLLFPVHSQWLGPYITDLSFICTVLAVISPTLPLRFCPCVTPWISNNTQTTERWNSISLLNVLWIGGDI